MKRLYLAVGVALLSCAGFAYAADAPATTPPATTPPASSDTQTPPPAQPATTTPPAQTQPDPNEKICKVEEMTGSRLGTKVCKTRKEWDEEAKAPGGTDF